MKRFPLYLSFILLLPALLAFSPAQQSNITMQVDAGIGGWYRVGQWIPLLVSVESATVTVDGQLQVRVGSSSGAAQFETTYRAPFTITEGSSKRVFLYVSLDDFTSSVQVEFVNRSGQVVVSQRETIHQLAYDDVLFAVVTDSSLGAPDVSRHPIGRGQNHQVTWRVEDIPPNADALRSLDILVFADADSGQLSGDQQQAIADWVLAGGHLMVTGGASWQRTTSGLLPLLPTVPESTTTLDDISPLGEFLFQPTDDLDTETLVVENTPNPDADILLAVDDIPLLVRHRIGSGTVDFVGIDAGIEPLRSWDALPYLWRELVLSAYSRPSWSYGIERFDLARDAVSNVTGFNLPAILQLATFLLVYIMLMGPANYFLLKLLGRREFAWFTIPTLIIVFSVFAYFTGFSVRGDDVTVNQISVVQVWDGVERARVDSVIGILSPRRTTYDVLIHDDLNLRTIPNVPGSVSQMSITQGEDYMAEDIPVDAAIMTTFAASGYIDAPLFSGEAAWIIRGEFVEPRIDGEVTNGMPVALQDAIILANDTVILLGDIPAGETRPFQMIAPLDHAARLTLGNRVDPLRPVMLFNNPRMPNQGNLCRMSSGPNVVYDSLMIQQNLHCEGGGDDETRRIRRRALIAAAINNEIDQNGGRGSRVFLLGWGDTPPLDIEISNTGQVEDGTVLYIYEIPTRIDLPTQNRVTIPPGLLTWTLIERDQPNRLPEINADLSFQVLGNQGVAIRFAPLPDVVLETVEEFVLTVDWRIGGVPVAISLWNWDSQEWQRVEFAADDQTQFIISDPAYVGTQNAVHVLVESEDAANFQTVNNVSVTLRGRG